MWLDERWDERNETSVRDLREWMDGMNERFGGGRWACVWGVSCVSGRRAG